MRKLVSFLAAVLCTASSWAQANKELYANLNLYNDLEFHNLFLSTADLGMSFYLNEGRCAIGPEVNVYRFFSPSYSTLGIGVRPFIRTYIVRGDKLSFFAECKGGVVLMFPEYPHQRINYNFVGGLGMDVQVSKHSALRTSIAFHHFSNAKRYESVYNNYSDGIGGYVGYVYRFK